MLETGKIPAVYSTWNFYDRFDEHSYKTQQILLLRDQSSVFATQNPCSQNFCNYQTAFKRHEAKETLDQQQ
jgi:hypothetical protein